MRNRCWQYRLIILFGFLFAQKLLLPAQTSAESAYGAYNTILGDTLLFEEGERLQYRLKEDKKWRFDQIGTVAEEGIMLGSSLVKWDQLQVAKGYLVRHSSILEYGTGKRLLIALIVILALLGFILAMGLLGGSPVYIIFPKVVGLSLLFLIPYILVLVSLVGSRFQRVNFGRNWRIIHAVSPNHGKR